MVLKISEYRYDRKNIYNGLEKILESRSTELMSYIKDGSNKYVPKDSGLLRESAEVKGKELIYHAPYSSYVYSMGVAKFTTPGTSGMWVERFILEQMSEIERLLNKGR